MSHTKTSQSEAEFFAREEAEKMRQLQQKSKQEHDIATREARKKLHFMKCPKCGDDLKTIERHLVQIEYCGSCGTTVLDKGELEKLTEIEQSSLKRIFDFFKG